MGHYIKLSIKYFFLPLSVGILIVCIDKYVLGEKEEKQPYEIGQSKEEKQPYRIGHDDEEIRFIEVTGNGRSHQDEKSTRTGEENAKKAAIMDAKRNLISQINGEVLKSIQKSENGNIAKDEITIEIEKYIKITKTEDMTFSYDKETGEAMVKIKFDLSKIKIWENL